LAQHSAQQARALLERWSPDPGRFAREVLGVEAWSRQRDIFRAVATHRRVSTRSGHKLSKTNSLACLALWWVCTKPRARVVLSSTVGDQLKNILWPEVCRLHREARVPIGGRLSTDYHGGLWFPDDRAILAMKSEDTKPESFAGISSPNLLYLIDEGSGFPDALLEAAWGNCASNGTIAAFSNPTRTAGWFYDAFHEKRASWRTLHIDSRESPNVTGECDVPGLARPEWVAELAQAFGADSPTFSVRVAGDFPRAGDCVVVSLGLIEAALRRDPEAAAPGPLRLGLDVGRTGDDPSVLCAARGHRTLPLRETHGREGDDLAGWVLQQLAELDPRGAEVPECRIDVIGVGASVYDHLKHSKRLKAIPVNVSTTPADPERYATTRDEVWFGGAEFLKEGGTLPPGDPELQGELIAARYSFNGRGRYVVASKDEMKKRLKRSPNRADAFNLMAYGRGSAPDADVAGWMHDLAAAGVGLRRDAPQPFHRPPEDEEDDDTPRGRW
jgi:phage terminase large subunit